MNEQHKTIICRKIKELRKQYGYTQLEVATLLNMSQNTYSDMESGKTKIDIERLYQIAQLYNISISKLLPPPPQIKLQSPFTAEIKLSKILLRTFSL